MMLFQLSALTIFLGTVSAFISPRHCLSHPALISSKCPQGHGQDLSLSLFSNLMESSTKSFSTNKHTIIAAKKKSSSKKKNSQSSSASSEENIIGKYPTTPTGSASQLSEKDLLAGGGDQFRPAPPAQLRQGYEGEERSSGQEGSSQPKFQRDRSLDALIIAEPKGQLLDQVRSSKVPKRPLIEIPDEAIVPDPKTKTAANSGPDPDAAFGLSGRTARARLKP